MSKYKTLITTQYLENYGAHSENGKFEDGNAYWKFKGGEQYVISTNSHQEANAVAFMSAYLQKDNDSRYGKQVITSWEFLPFSWVEEDTCSADDPFATAPIYIDIEEYFELQKSGSGATPNVQGPEYDTAGGTNKPPGFFAGESDPGPVEKSGFGSPVEKQRAGERCCQLPG